MTQIVIRHLTGSKANQADEFPLEADTQLSFGRDPSTSVSYDPDRDDLVGRRQAEIKHDPEDETRFTLTDLDSRNGTFLNGNRISGTVDLSVGDTVRFGDGGPEFVFDLDPRPDWAVKATRVGTAVPATRVGATTGAAGATGATGAGDAARGVGKDTVERMIEGQGKAQSRNMLGMAAGILAILAVVAGAAIFMGDQKLEDAKGEAQKAVDEAAASRPWTAEQVANEFSESTVLIEFAWKLIDTNSGKQVFHHYVELEEKGEDGGTQYAPGYIQLPDGTVEPWLVRGDSGTSRPIGIRGGGTGFVVSENGFILTNRHVATNWHTKYTALPLPGIVFSIATGEPVEAGILNEGSEINFIPAKAQLLGGEQISGKNIEGRLDYLDVTFRRNKLRIPAEVERISDTADVALIKIDTPSSVKKVELFDNYDLIRSGQPITVLGYPGVSPDVVVGTSSQDLFNRAGSAKVVPEPTVSTGVIGKVIRGAMEFDDPQMEYLSFAGDTYQLTVNSTGPGNSGGPVFDGQGRVIGLFTWGTFGTPTITFATPIKYGLELMDIRSVID